MTLGQASARQPAVIADGADAYFPEFVALSIRSVPHLDTFAYRMKKRGEEGKGQAKRFRAEALALLNALIMEDRQSLP
ncbi:hypothetical protein [Sphingomonas sanguinis]|uniref:hypothetical protein n=1 Tax=Sphingomonas sanguinis TaxID=33051 RepID=UPI00301A15CC